MPTVTSAELWPRWGVICCFVLAQYVTSAPLAQISLHFLCISSALDPSLTFHTRLLPGSSCDQYASNLHRPRPLRFNSLDNQARYAILSQIQCDQNYARFCTFQNESGESASRAFPLHQHLPCESCNITIGALDSAVIRTSPRLRHFLGYVRATWCLALARVRFGTRCEKENFFLTQTSLSEPQNLDLGRGTTFYTILDGI